MRLNIHYTHLILQTYLCQIRIQQTESKAVRVKMLQLLIPAVYMINKLSILFLSFILLQLSFPATPFPCEHRKFPSRTRNTIVLCCQVLHRQAASSCLCRLPSELILPELLMPALFGAPGFPRSEDEALAPGPTANVESIIRHQASSKSNPGLEESSPQSSAKTPQVLTLKLCWVRVAQRI